MVSTRGVKTDGFVEGEKVLCYEPDITKAKVLYDAKVMFTFIFFIKIISSNYEI